MNKLQQENREAWLNRLSACVHSQLAKAMSNLRLSLTLRIALHYAGQLLKTTLPVLLVLMFALCAAEMPAAVNAMETLGNTRPMNAQNYAQDQLTGLPLEKAWLLDEPLKNREKQGKSRTFVFTVECL